jgi:hypothetical protein
MQRLRLCAVGLCRRPLKAADPHLRSRLLPTRAKPPTLAWHGAAAACSKIVAVQPTIVQRTLGLYLRGAAREAANQHTPSMIDPNLA